MDYNNLLKIINNLHLHSREKDIQKLCKQVINLTNTVYMDCRNDYTECPLCGEDTDGEHYDLEKLNHKPNCGFLIAKDLSTNIDRRNDEPIHK